MNRKPVLHLLKVYCIGANRYWIKVICIVIIIVTLVDELMMKYHESLYVPSGEHVKKSVRHIDKKKVILLYDTFWGVKDWEVGLGSEPFTRLGCPVRNCELTYNKSRINVSDAVLFHTHELRGKPPPKIPGQKFVFFMLESPGWSQNMKYTESQWRYQFDWTMTYRLDSDVIIRYGRVWRSNRGKRLMAIPKSKSKLVAWIVSNCQTQSKRDEYMRELARHIDVDVYGRCGNMTCTKDWLGGDQKCLEMVNEQYYFYVAFENSFCMDYVTEKYFKVLPLDVVPIVRGGADYSDFTPEKWYINTKDFAQPHQLASYLRYLAETPEKYLEYFENKHLYESMGYFGIRELYAWCELCEKLNDPYEMKTEKSLDVSTWWSMRDCQKPTDLIWK